jgi:hypothetical protein
MLRASMARIGVQEKHAISGRVYDFPEEVICRIAYFRSSEKRDPLFYARLIVRMTDESDDSLKRANGGARRTRHGRRQKP